MTVKYCHLSLSLSPHTQWSARRSTPRHPASEREARILRRRRAICKRNVVAMPMVIWSWHWGKPLSQSSHVSQSVSNQRSLPAPRNFTRPSSASLIGAPLAAPPPASTVTCKRLGKCAASAPGGRAPARCRMSAPPSAQFKILSGGGDSVGIKTSPSPFGSIHSVQIWWWGLIV